MTVLHDIGDQVGVSERTLRRAVADGAVRADRESAHRLTITDREREWVLRHWPTVAALRGVLRTELSVRLAVLFGSVARGTELESSDLDLMVAVDGGGPSRLAALEERLTAVAGRPVQVVRDSDVLRSPTLLADVVRDGRVLIDRDGLWQPLARRRDEFDRAAAGRDDELLAAALEPLVPAR